MYDLIILTTAIDRPDLHNQTLPPFFDMLEKQRINYKWIVNLDSPFNKREAALNNLKTFDYDFHNHDIHILHQLVL